MGNQVDTSGLDQIDKIEQSLSRETAELNRIKRFKITSKVVKRNNRKQLI